MKLEVLKTYEFDTKSISTVSEFHGKFWFIFVDSIDNKINETVKVQIPTNEIPRLLELIKKELQDDDLQPHD